MFSILIRSIYSFVVNTVVLPQAGLSTLTKWLRLKLPNVLHLKMRTRGGRGHNHNQQLPQTDLYVITVQFLILIISLALLIHNLIGSTRHI